MRQGQARRGGRLRALATLALAVLAAIASPALGQGPGGVTPPPVRQAIDENGVDVIRGKFNAAQPSVSIGPAYPHGLVYSSSNAGSGWFNGANSLIHQSGSSFLVSAAGASDSFTQSGTTFTPTEANGASLAQSGPTFTYTSRNGLVATFTLNSAGLPFWDATVARATTLTFPDGTRIHFHHKIVEYCPGGEAGDPSEVPLTCPTGYKLALRLQSITSNHGYQLKFGYQSDALDDRDPSTSYDIWSSVVSVRAISNAVDYCSPTADACTGLTQPWPLLTLTSGGPTELTVATPSGEATRFSYGSDGITGIRRPGAAGDNVVVTYSGGKVATTRIDGILYSYAYVDAGNVRTTTVTAPDGGKRVYVSDTVTFRLSSFKDELERVTSYEYDPNGRPTRITAPEGNETRLTYDARGNVTETRAEAKPNSSLDALVATADYPASCANPRTCNQPTSTTDPRDNTTDYAYDPVHGGVTGVTLPAPAPGAARPQTRTAYAAFRAHYKDASGEIVASAFPVQLPTSVSQCQTQASCAGTADEVRTVIDWGPQTPGIPNNLLPVSSSSGSGDGALTATASAAYDAVGNLAAVDGPLPGEGDTMIFRYDAARRRVGTISPDPDGTDPLLRRAERLTYIHGLLVRVEQGTVGGSTDADWAAFAALQMVDLVYDADARPVRRVLSGGGFMQAVTDLEYDDLGRLECSAVRMKPSAWTTLTAGCMAQTGAGEVPDRIGRTIYDLAGQVTQVQTAVGTGDQATETASTYRTNGRLETLTDGEGNKTTYEYDGHDRLARTRFPSPALGSGVSSATDYEELTYDPNGNVETFRNRAGETIAFGYDALNRVILKDLPGGEPDVAYGYDLLGRLTDASQPGHALSFAWDALGRNLAQTGPLGSVRSDWDAAGRRIRLTHPDGFFVDYDYQPNSADLIRIRENGATSAPGLLATFDYDDLGRRTRLTRGNGTVTIYAYDPVSRLAELTQDLAGAASDLTLGFAYNAASQIVANSRSNSLYSWTGHSFGTVSTTANGLNQLAAWNVPLGHDAKGNIVAVGGASYGYSSENLLTSAPANTLRYDPLMRLHSLSGGINLRRLYDGDELIAEYNNAGALLRRFVHGPGVDEPLVWYGSGGTARMFLHADERGSIVAATDNQGAPAYTYRYDEYGGWGAGNAGRFYFTGQTGYAELGLYYYKARWYHPGLGRFLQPDPIGYASGMNLYAYVSNDPINFVDPAGTCYFENWALKVTHVETGDWWYKDYWVRFYGCERWAGLGGFGGDVSGGGMGGPEGESTDELGPCTPQQGDIFPDARSATLAGARATALRSALGRHPRQEFHAQIDPARGGYAFKLRDGPIPRGSNEIPSVGLSAGPYSGGSAHFHPRESYGRGGNLSVNDREAYQQIYEGNLQVNPDFARNFYVGLVNRDVVYLWEPGRPLGMPGRKIGPAKCH
jgi:RHS repeat-associated protein